MSNRRSSRRAFLQLASAWLLPARHTLAAGSSGTVTFTDVAAHAGLGNARNVSGPVEDKQLLLEEMGCGAAIIDYDNDGWPDIFLVNGTTLKAAGADRPPTSYLFRNNRDGTFTDVTRKAGLNYSGWGQACCVGDYDNDGFDDLLVTYWGRNVLYHNNGDGTFTDVSEKAGVAGAKDRWNVGCCFLDYDRDGHLDLFVANYIAFDPATAPRPDASLYCRYGHIPVPCGPQGFAGGTNLLFRNRGDGTFEDVSEKSGIANPRGAAAQSFVKENWRPTGSYGMGAASADFDNDGWPDIYVACDTAPSLLYHNNGDGTFQDVSLRAGLGINTKYLGFGVGFLDFDNDGHKDIFIANGHVYTQIEGRKLHITYKQPRLLYRNLGNGRFRDVSAESGAAISALNVGRGCAFGDLDNDGDIDILINNLDGPPSLLRNDGGNRNNWLLVKCIGTRSNRSAIGARVSAAAGNHTQTAEVMSGSGYYSQNDLRLHFGLGSAKKVDLLQVSWPSGVKEAFRDVEPNQLLVIKESSGIVRREAFPAGR